MRLFEQDHALLDLPGEDVLADELAPEHLAIEELGGLGQVTQDDAAVAIVAGVDHVQHREYLETQFSLFLSLFFY